MRKWIVMIAATLFLPALAWGQKTCTRVTSTSQNCLATIGWTASAVDATHDAPTGYSVRRSDAGAAKAEIGKVDAKTTSFQNTFTDAGGVAHCWDVVATNAAGSAPASNQDCWTTPAIAGTAPSTPQGLTISAVSRNVLRVTWSDVSDNSGFEIWGRLARATDFDQVAILPADSTFYDWAGRVRYTSYCAQVRALSGNLTSAFSSISCATTNN